MAKSERDQMVELFKNIKYFCATSDIWSRSNRSFIAVSVHFFDENSFSLRTKFIACESFAGRHTHDKVADKLHSIFSRYGILPKVFFITTDGAGEFTAAFKFYSENYHSFKFLDASEENIDLTWLNRQPLINAGTSTNVTAAAQEESDDDTESDSESEDMNLSDNDLYVRKFDLDGGAVHASSSAAGQKDDSNSFLILNHESSPFPPLLAHMNRIDCAAHKLEKLGRVDALNAKSSDENYADLYDRVFSKLEAIWAVKDSRLNAEIFSKITGKRAFGPHRIRWLKTWEAVCVATQNLNVYL